MEKFPQKAIKCNQASLKIKVMTREKWITLIVSKLTSLNLISVIKIGATVLTTSNKSSSTATATTTTRIELTRLTN